MFLRPFGWYFSACFGILFVYILCTCCSHLSWYWFISFTMFCAPVFPLIYWFFSLSSFVIPYKCLKNFICVASKRCSSLFFSTQDSLPNSNAALDVMLWILILFICSLHFKCLNKILSILYTFFAQFRKHSQHKMSVRIYRVTVGSVSICGVKDILRLAAYTNIWAPFRNY